ncbi:MAG: hypothetical protein ACM3KR_00385 [Deltaproteobacteria bacterium]
MIKSFEGKIEEQISPYIRDTADKKSLYCAKNKEGKGTVVAINGDLSSFCNTLNPDHTGR